MTDSPRARFYAYGLALLAPAITLLVRWPLEEVLGDRVLYMAFIPAILVVAYVGGLWPGLITSVLSALAATYFLVSPFHSLEITTAPNAVALCLLLLIGAIISVLSESLHRTRRRLVANERRRSEEALREAEDRFRQMAENIHEIFWMMDSRHERVFYISPTYEEIWGRTCQSLYDQPHSWIDSIHPDDRTAVIDNMEKRQTGIFTDLEFRVVRADGSVRWIRSRSFPIHYAGGNDSRIAGVAEDITDRKQAAELLLKSEQRFRTFVDHATDAFFLQDRNYVILDVNRQACESLGYTREELIGMTPADIDPNVTPSVFESLTRSLDAGQVMSFESSHRRKDGTIFPVEIRGQAFYEGGRRITVAMVRDITERKRTEEALRESEQRWRSLTEALPQLVWSALPDGACDYFSMQWTQHTGVPEERLLGWQWMETLHPDDREPTRLLWTNSVAGRGPYDVEYRVRRTDGEYRWFKTRGVPIRDSDGRIFKWFGTCTDITDGRRAAEELRLAKEAAESANRAKDEFLANVSHEIRTPMNAILGMTDLVLGTSLSDDQRQSLRTVKTAADNLLNILNDLLDFSKIEAGKLELDLADFSLRGALGDALRTLAMRAHTKGLELVSHVQPDVPDALVGDAGRLRQVLLNLIGNAIKFTERGEVVVTVRRDPSLPSSFIPHPSSLIFRVSDTGIGIPLEKQEKIFRAFEQEDTSTTRKYGGTGLGLTIAARLVALMGGTITVDSQPGRGSTFAFTAQFSVREEGGDRRDEGKRGADFFSSLIPQPSSLLYNIPVLIIDDNATNCHILQEWLRSWQMEPMAVGDGVTALNALGDAVTRARPYPLVLLDARMPDTDGLTLAAKIRRRPELSATRIILLTSGDMPSNLGRLRELRIDAHLLKPAQQEELLETIYQVMNRSQEEAGGRRDERKLDSSVVPRIDSSLIPHASSLHILVAEDNDFNSQLLEQLLVRRGHRVQLARDGRQALSLVVAGGTFDLLLLDVHMPEMDGFQVIHAIRERERSESGHLPVIALTARSRKEDRERCLAAGMDDFLAKPIQTGDLWAAIDRVVRSKDENGNRILSSLIPHRSSMLLDPRVLLAACGGDAGILENLCRAFQTSLPVHLTAVTDAFRDGDASRLRESAHKLCGMVSVFSTEAGSVASDIEDHAAQGQLDEARPLLARLELLIPELLRQTDGLSIDSLRNPTKCQGDVSCSEENPSSHTSQ